MRDIPLRAATQLSQCAIMGWNGWSSLDVIHKTVCIGLRDIGKATHDTLVEIKASKRYHVL